MTIKESAKMLVDDYMEHYKKERLPLIRAKNQSDAEEGLIQKAAKPTRLVSDRVSFLVERVVGKGVRINIAGKPDSAEVITDTVLNQSVNRVAYGYTDKHCGPREKVGNKGGTLYNKIKAVWN